MDAKMRDEVQALDAELDRLDELDARTRERRDFLMAEKRKIQERADRMYSAGSVWEDDETFLYMLTQWGRGEGSRWVLISFDGECMNVAINAKTPEAATKGMKFRAPSIGDWARETFGGMAERLVVRDGQPAPVDDGSGVIIASKPGHWSPAAKTEPAVETPTCKDRLQVPEPAEGQVWEWIGDSVPCVVVGGQWRQPPHGFGWLGIESMQKHVDAGEVRFLAHTLAEYQAQQAAKPAEVAP